MSAQTPATESTPLLDHEAGGTAATSDNDNLRLAQKTRVFYMLSVTSVVTGILTLSFCVVSFVLLHTAPWFYVLPPYFYSNLPFVAAWSIIGTSHSGITLVAADGIRVTIVGVLVDLFTAMYLIFESLFIMQVFRYPSTYPFPGRCEKRYVPPGSPPPSMDDCIAWAKWTEPLMWMCLIFAFLLGVTHLALLFLRDASFKCSATRSIRVILVDEEGNATRR